MEDQCVGGCEAHLASKIRHSPNRELVLQESVPCILSRISHRQIQDPAPKDLSVGNSTRPSNGSIGVQSGRTYCGKYFGTGQKQTRSPIRQIRKHSAPTVFSPPSSWACGLMTGVRSLHAPRDFPLTSSRRATGLLASPRR